MPGDYDVARALIESALPEVEVIACPMCHGKGSLAHALELTCPRCNGSGKTTNSGTPLTRWDEHGPD